MLDIKFNLHIIRTTSECPTCHEQIRRENVTVDHEYQKEIQNLPVYCSNRQFGCAWEGIFKNHAVIQLLKNNSSFEKN